MQLLATVAFVGSPTYFLNVVDTFQSNETAIFATFNTHVTFPLLQMIETHQHHFRASSQHGSTDRQTDI